MLAICVNTSRRFGACDHSRVASLSALPAEVRASPLAGRIDGGIDRGDQLERIQFLPTNIHFLEYQTDGLATVVPVETDDWHFVALDGIDDAPEKLRLNVERPAFRVFQ